jgi:hypothetical protein
VRTGDAKAPLARRPMRSPRSYLKQSLDTVFSIRQPFHFTPSVFRTHPRVIIVQADAKSFCA